MTSIINTIFNFSLISLEHVDFRWKHNQTKEPKKKVFASFKGHLVLTMHTFHLNVNAFGVLVIFVKYDDLLLFLFIYEMMELIKVLSVREQKRGTQSKSTHFGLDLLTLINNAIYNFSLIAFFFVMVVLVHV